MNTLHLNGLSLTLEDLAPLLRGERVRLAVVPDVLPRVRASRQKVEQHVAAGDVVYGLTTGFGKLKNTAVPAAQLVELQRNLVLSHSVGVGEPMPLHEVRMAQVLRLNSLLVGVSGVRVELIETLLRFFNADFVPEVPQQGSVGASGDLAPLSHMVAAYMGSGYAYVAGERLPAAEALDRIQEQPLELAAKEGLALINGTEVMKAIGVCNVLRARNLSKAADAIAALSVEALFGSSRPFQERLSELRPHLGQSRAAANLRACLADSEVMRSHASCDRVQDAYSLRCVPQIHGAFKASLAHVGEVLDSELNAVTDNPVVDPVAGEVYSAGLFHGQPLSLIQDYLGIAACTLANVSERRVEQMVNPDLSGLPAFLVANPGLNSGLMIAQYTAAALASENKSMAHPASVDSIPTSAGQEDHVSMGVTAARKLRSILTQVEQGLGIELVCAGQAREFHLDLRAGHGAQAAFDCLRAQVAPLDQDRYLAPDLEAGRRLVADGALVAAVEAAVGPLLS